MNFKQSIAAISISLLAGFGLGYWALPSKVIEKTKFVDKVRVKRDVVTVTVTKPDGSSVKTTTDKSKIDEDTKKDTFKQTERSNLNWILSASYLQDLNGKRELVGSLHRRIFGEVYLGIVGSSHGTAGLGLLVRF